MAIIASKQEIHNVLKETKSIAVIGASIKKERPAHYVAAYLDEQGYQIFAVNPVYAGKSMFGKTIFGKLDDIDQKVDVVDVFRRSEHLMDEFEGILAIKPKIVWLQKGIKNKEFASALDDHGIDIIQDKCMLEEHKAMKRPL